MRILSRVMALTLTALFGCAVGDAAEISVEVMLPLTAIDADGDKNVFSTPFAYRDGKLFTVHVEPPPSTQSNGVDLQTVVRHGQRQNNGSWLWTARLIEGRTILDTWHTQASIGLDKDGYVHVAYNMHNMPWQYCVSKHPYDISAFTFRGEPLTLDQIKVVKYLNRTPFPDIGSASIPGNQVTYPMFFNDNRGELYVTYRYATKPARNWQQRGFAGGLARYDTEQKRWSAIGGKLALTPGDATNAPASAYTVPMVFEDTYSVYLITLAFDGQNGMHAVWTWRPGGAGEDNVIPSYAHAPDGGGFAWADGSSYTLPIRLRDAEAFVTRDETQKFYAPKSIAVLPDGTPLIVVHPISGGRKLISYDTARRTWSLPSPTPDGAMEVVVDKQGRIWAFATGLKVFMKESLARPWSEVGTISGLCSPKVRYYPVESRFVIHAKTCDGRQVTIVSFRR